MEINASGVHSQLCRPPQLLIDGRWIERIFLPHLQLVDSSCRCVVRPNKPSMLSLPGIGFLGSPNAEGRLAFYQFAAIVACGSRKRSEVRRVCRYSVTKRTRSCIS